MPRLKSAPAELESTVAELLMAARASTFTACASYGPRRARLLADPAPQLLCLSVGCTAAATGGRRGGGGAALTGERR